MTLFGAPWPAEHCPAPCPAPPVLQEHAKMVRKKRLELRRGSKYNPYATLHYRGVSLLFSIVFVIFVWHRA